MNQQGSAPPESRDPPGLSGGTVVARQGAYPDRPRPLQSVATVGSRVTNACVARDGRLICGFPRWQDGFEHPAVAEITPEGTPRSLLPPSWDGWSAGQPGHDKLVSIHALYRDDANQLWILDDGCPKLGPPVEGGPKIIQYDLDNGQVARVYALPPPATHGASILSHMRSDDSHLYVTDAGSGGILVIDRDTGATRVVLHRHPLTQADPHIVPMINGKPYKSAHGKVATLHLSHLEISGDGRWMYFFPLFGPRLQRLPMESLRDPDIDDDGLARQVEFVCGIPPVAGIHALGEHEFLLCAATEGRILHLDHDGKLSTFVDDERICFPNEGGFDASRKYFYFPNSGAHLIGRPFEVFRVALE